MKEIANCELCQRSKTKHCQGCHLGTNFLAKTADTQKQHNDFYEAVCRQFKDCKTANDIAVRNFELMKVVADVSWEANAVRETEAEAKIISYMESKEKRRCFSCKYHKEYKDGGRKYYSCINPEVLNNLDVNYFDENGNCTLWEAEKLIAKVEQE